MKIQIIILISCLATLTFGQGEFIPNSTNQAENFSADFRSDVAIEKRINQFFKLIPDEKLVPVLSDDYLDVSIFNRLAYIPNTFEESILVDQINEVSNNYGLEFIANARYNVNNIISSDDETGDDKTRYSAYVGVEWNVLNKGWKENQIREQILTNELEITRLDKKANRDKMQLTYNQIQISVLFNQFLLEELKYHKNIYDKQIKLYQELYYQNLTPYTTIIDLKKNLRQVELQINQINNYDKQFDTNLKKDVEKLPIFDLNLDKLIQRYSANTIRKDSIDTKRKELLENKYKLNTLPSLSVYALHRAFKPQNGTGLRQSPVVGLNFEMPLQNFKPYQQNGFGLESQIIDDISNLEKEADIHKICDYYVEYQQILREVKRLYYQLHWEKEQLQSALITKQKADDKVKITTVTHLNNVLTLRRDIIQYQQELYRIALNIFTIVGLKSLKPTSPMLVPINWEEVRPNRAIMVLNTAKDLTDIQFYVHYMKRKNFNKVYLVGEKNQTFRLTAELLAMEGFELFFKLDDRIPRKIVSQFESVKELRKYTEKIDETIIITDIHELINLELGNYTQVTSITD